MSLLTRKQATIFIIFSLFLLTFALPAHSGKEVNELGFTMRYAVFWDDTSIFNY